MRDHPEQAHVSTASADPDIIDALEKHLERARRGELVAVALVAQHADGGTSTGWVVGDDGSVFGLLGAVTYLESRIVREHIEGPDDEDAEE